MQYSEIYLKKGEGYILSHINFSISSKRIGWADIESKTLNLLKTDNKRIIRHQERLKNEYKDYKIIYY